MSGPSWKEMIASATEKGMLAKEFFIVFTEPAADIDKILEVRAEHLKYQVEIEQKGIMFAAGPLADDDGNWGGDGMIVIRADSLESARQIADADPMHSSGARTYSIRPWLMNEGGFNLRVTFSDGKHKIT